MNFAILVRFQLLLNSLQYDSESTSLSSFTEINNRRNKHKNIDGFLYVLYSGQNTYG